MAISSTVDLSTLGWVKTEIEETLKQARQALESYLDNADEGQLRFCATHIHQVIGTLEMVELDGPAMLARELEAYVEAMIDEKFKPDKDNFEILIQGILSLPEYLSRLEVGQPDAPVRLLPIINSLRERRDDELLNEVDFFNPDMSIRPPKPDGEDGLPEDKYSAFAKRLRPKFQASLLAWLRDTSSRDAIDGMVEVLDELSVKARLGVIQQLFWVASGLLEAMVTGDLEPTNERKKLLSRLDQQMKKLVEGSEKTELRDTSESLVKTILYELGGAGNGSPKVVQLKQAFDLELLLGKVATEGESVVDDLPTPEVMASVAAALKTEINLAQDQLAEYFEPDNDKTQSLEKLLELLHKMSGTMEMLGVPLLKSLVDILTDVCQKVEDGEIQADENASMNMARGMLLIENSARDISRSADDWKKQIEEGIVLLENLAGYESSMPGTEGLEVSDGELTASDFKQLLEVVAEEIRVNLGSVEEDFESFATNQSDISFLQSMQDSLGQIYGAMQIIGQEDAGVLVDRTMAALRDISRGVVDVDNNIMDALAVAVGSIGAYLDGLLYNRSNLDALIDLAFQELVSAFENNYRYANNPSALVEGIEDSVTAWRGSYNSYILAELKREVKAAILLAEELGLEAVVSSARGLSDALTELESANENNFDVASDAVSINAAGFIEIASEVFTDSAVPATATVTEGRQAVPEEPVAQTYEPETAVPAQTAAAALAADDEDFDEEIMEIFIEDARDSVDTINNNFPAWRDSDDNAAMLEVRRGFHTIKGSGRMVGVGDIAELAWAFENMLNKVRDGKLQRNEQMVTLIQQVTEVLPVMINALENRTIPNVDHENLRLAAEAVAEGQAARTEQPAPVIPASPPSAEPPAEPVAAPGYGAGDVAAELDDALFNIFVTETEGHLQSIRNHVAAAQKKGSCFADADMIRVAHTIAGSGRSVGLTEMSNAAKEMEKLFLEAQEKGYLLTREPIDLYEELEHQIARLVQAMRDNNGVCRHSDMVTFTDLANRITDAAMRLGKTAEINTGPDIVQPAEPVREPVAPVESVAPPAAPEEDVTMLTEELGAILAGDMSQAPSEPSIPAMQIQPVENDVVYEQVDPDLVDIFYEEAVDILQNINDAISRWRRNPGDATVTADLKRALHTFKGGARMAGAMTLGEIAHKTETLLDKLETGVLTRSTALVDLLEEVHDSCGAACEELNSNQPMTGLKTLDLKLSHFDGSTATAPVSSAAVTAAAMEPGETPQPAVTPAVTTPAAQMSMPADNIDPDLAEIFYEEAVDLLQVINDGLVKWRNDMSNTAVLSDLKRAMHTFKGGSRMAGAMSLGQVAHMTETAIERVEGGALKADVALLDTLDEVHDTFLNCIEQVKNNQPISGLELVAGQLDTAIRTGNVPAAKADTPAPAISHEDLIKQKLAAAEKALSDKQSVNAVVKQDQPASNEPAAPPPEPMPVITQPTLEQVGTADPMALLREEAFVEKGKGLDKAERREQIRVRTDLLDTLSSYAGEVSISRSRMEQQVYGLRENLDELGGNVQRFREQLRELEIQSESQMAARLEQEGVQNIEDFDPLEFDRFSALQQLSRSLTESLHDLTSIQNSLGNFASEAETVLVQQARVNTELQEGLMKTRMVALSTQATRLRHIVRQTSRELGKQAQLVINNTEVEMDRNVLERMIGPFEHMIRNALDHGLESIEERKAAGKPEIGTISIDPVQQGNEVVIRVSDDGRGLNIPAIRKKAIEQGLISPDSSISDEEVTQFILMAGFSTASAVTHISGRGVGMDVVHNEVRQLGGSMSVQTDPGRGTSFVISLPLTLSIMQALMIKVGDQQYAVPLSAVINLIEMPASEIRGISIGDNPLLNYKGEVYSFMHLGERLGISSSANRGKKVPILLARSGPREVAIEVEGLAGTREIVIKNVGPQAGSVKGIGGATILGDGSVIMILDIPGLWLHDETMHLSEAVAQAAAPAVGPPAPEVIPEAPPAMMTEEPVEESRPPVVMVVDDSLTVRKITSRHLQKRGMEVLTAKDGLDAVEQLRDVVPDVMLVDIEMPRMDGYELTSRVRSESRLKHIPIIMITSRAGSKHREKALGLGVDIYMSKPYQEDTLLSNIEQMLDVGRERSS